MLLFICDSKIRVILEIMFVPEKRMYALIRLEITFGTVHIVEL